MDPKKKNFYKGAAIGLGVGAIAGAIAGILYAPKSGEETREDIKKYYHEMKDKIAERVANLKDITRETYGQVVAEVVAGYEEHQKINATEAANIKKALDEGYEKVKEAADKAKQ